MNDPRTQSKKRTPSEIRDAARRTFSSAAHGYVTSDAHRTGADLDRLVAIATERLGSLEARYALDIATGGGHAALALAKAGARVTATDLTPEMLAAAEAFVRAQVPGIEITFGESDATELPFDDGSFDLVTSRIAAHHFPNPLAFLREAARVLRPAGLLVLIDNVAPEEASLARAMNELERRRDESHVEAYPVSWWVSRAVRARLEPVHVERFWREKPFSAWATRTPPQGLDGKAHAEQIERFVRGLPAPARAYLGERDDHEGRLAFLRHEVALVAAERRCEYKVREG